MKNKFAILLVFLCQLGHSQILKGKVVDNNTGDGVPFAKIYCLETQNGSNADSSGTWQLDNIIYNQMTIQISAPEYDSKMIKVDSFDYAVIVKMNPAHIHLDEVIISTSDSKLQRYSAFPVESRKIADLNKIEQTNLVDAMSNIPGIYNFSTGNGIATSYKRTFWNAYSLHKTSTIRKSAMGWIMDLLY